MDTRTRALLVCIAMQLGVIVGQVAGILAATSGATTIQAFVSGGIAFAATVPLALLVKNEIFK